MTPTPRDRNDGSLEWLTFGARVASALLALLTVALSVPAVRWGGWRDALTLLWSAALAAGVGWWGWWYQGNAEWARPRYRGCGARNGQFVCNVIVSSAGRHPGPHADSIRDPNGNDYWR